FSKKATRTPSILSKDHPPDKKPKSDKNTVPPAHEFDPTGLVQRCVIIQKDENGFGLTVSGDNPVFVQLVKEDGAAMRAGVQTGDRIIKVNGTLVTHSNHVEVVKLIKLLGRPPGLAQISLSEGEGGDLSSFLSSSQSPGPTGGTGERCATSSTSPQDHITSPLPLWKENNALHSQKDGSLSPRDSEVEEGGFGAADGEQTPSSRGESGSDGPWTNNTVSPSPLPESPCQRETPCHSPKTTPRESLNSCPSPDVEDTPDLLCYLYADLQKRSMGLTLAEGELAKLDTERADVTAHRRGEVYVILTYMKHLGVKVKEPRSLEPKRVRINFLPKIKKSIKTEKEGEEKVKKPRFPSILGPPRRPSRVDSASISKAMEMNKQRGPQKQLSQPALSVSEHPEFSAGGIRARSQFSDPGSDAVAHPLAFMASPPYSAPASQGSDPTGRDSDSAPALWTNYRRRSVKVTGPKREARPNQPGGCGDVPSEDDQGNEIECEQDPPNWQALVSREVLAGLTPQEIKRQEVINELFYTERAHLRMLKVLDNVFYQKLTRDGILPPGDIKHIFTNLEEIVQLHVWITEQMTVIRKKNETSFSDDEEEKIKRAVGTFCSNQPFALELIKTRQKKDQRFTSFMQEAESNRLCRRLQLKDIIPVEMQRLTKYPLLLESIAKYTEDTEERDKVKRAGECCREILNYVNQTVKEAENKQRLEDYQRRLDLSSLKQSENPMISEFKSCTRCSWRISWCCCRSRMSDNKSFFVLSMSDNGAQIYELMAQTVSEQRMWQCLITQSAETMKTETHNIIPLPQTDAERDAVEIISTGVPKLSKDPERTSMGCTESPEKDVTSSPGLQPMPTSTNPFDGVKSDDEEEEDSPLPDRREEQEEEEEVEEVDEEEIEAFLDGELADRLPFLQERSRQGIAIDDQEPDDTFGMPPSRAEEALRTLAALRQVLLNHMTSRAEGSDKDKEKGKEKEKEQRKGRAPGGRLLRTTSLRGPEDNNSSTSAPRSAAAPSTGSSENGASERTEAGREEGTPGSMKLRSGDTGFFETSEDYGSYMVLEGYGASGESSTDGGGGAQWGPDIDLKKLLSSSSQTGSGDQIRVSDDRAPFPPPQEDKGVTRRGTPGHLFLPLEAHHLSPPPLSYCCGPQWRLE
ncbi:unnamed protein product, partial [Coregonus sp. 'balchen']